MPPKKQKRQNDVISNRTGTPVSSEPIFAEAFSDENATPVSKFTTDLSTTSFRVGISRKRGGLSRQPSNLVLLDIDPDSQDSGISLGSNRTATPLTPSGDIKADDEKSKFKFKESKEANFVRNDLKESADACASKIFEKPDDSILRPGPSAAAEGHKRSEVPISVLSAANQKMPTDFSQLICSNSKTSCAGELSQSSRPKLSHSSPPCKQIILHRDDSTVCAIHRTHSTPELHRNSTTEEQFSSPEDRKVVYSLPTVKNPKKPHLAYACIDSHTLANLIESMDENQFNKRFLLVDCRYPYEYDGGHIWYAVNLAETSSIPSFFFPEDGKMFEERNARVPIFYCEYSSQRGPAMARALRKHDRERNFLYYPKMDYKEMYLLECGYRRFFSEPNSQRFIVPVPPKYVRMTDPAHSKQLAKYDAHKKGDKKTGKRRIDGSKKSKSSPCSHQ